MSCPCGSSEPFEQCCGPFLGGAPAPTAEKLMRSRYTAYVRGAIDYIIATHDPETRDEVDREVVESWSRESEWTGLTILATEAGGESDDEGSVEFIARFRAEGYELSHHEQSRFRKLDGCWYFVDGQVMKATPARATPTVGRNALCPCGSGKKYKRCHGA